MDLLNYKEKVKVRQKDNIQFFRRLKKVKPKVLDKQIHLIHKKVFGCTDCLECANCCTTTSPVFTDKDIIRISRYLRIKPSKFSEKYLCIDKDKDYVLKSVPCSFLGDNNYCDIYDVRPKACREFPHTDRRKQYQLLDLTQKNMAVCPAVFNIIETLKIESKLI